MPVASETAGECGLLVQLLDTTATVVKRLAAEKAAREVQLANQALVVAGIREQVSASRALKEVDGALTARRQAEREAREVLAREEELRLNAEFRERLIGIVGHDLRNPLSTIIAASALQISHGRLTDEDARLAALIVNSGQRMARMIHQLVEFTKARLGGGFDLKPEPCNVAKVCHEIAEEHRIASSSEIRQTTEGDLEGTWDADRLAEALSNLVGNAVDHATPGTPIAIHARGNAESIAVDVTNQGAPIPSELLAVIFAPFRRGQPNAKARSNHLGLGLYIASEIVRSHGGTLEVRSRDGTTTFTMWSPRRTASHRAN